MRQHRLKKSLQNYNAMYTSYLTKQHTKALSILEMIAQNNNRMNALKSNLHHVRFGKFDNPIRLFNREKDVLQDIEDRKKIGKRLENYYLTTMIKINENSFKQLAKN